MSRSVEDALEETPGPAPRVIVDNAPLIASFFTSFFALQVLYSVTSQGTLWIVVVCVVDLIVQLLKRLVARCLYTKLESDDIDQQATMQLFRFIHLVLVFIVTRIVIDVALVGIYTSVMYWYQYINLLALAIFS